MKYIRYTYVDYKTRKPISVEPAVNGPDMPEGIKWVFTVESGSQRPTPILYGTASDKFQLEPWMYELSKEEFIRVYKNEVLARSREKRARLMEFKVRFGENGDVIKVTDNTRKAISDLAVNMSSNQIIQFETTDGKWYDLSAEDVKNLNSTIFMNVQTLYKWTYGVDRMIDEAKTIKDIDKILEGVNSYVPPFAFDEETEAV